MMGNAVRAFGYRIGNIVKNKAFLLAVVINAWFIWSAGEMYLEKYVDLLEGLQTTYILGMTPYITPIVASLPYVMKFYEEKSTGAYRIHVIRAGKLGYAVRKILESLLSGMLVMAGSLLLYTLFGVLYAVWHRLPIVFIGIEYFYGEAGETNIYVMLLEQGKGGIVYLLHCLCLFFYGMIWPCIGTAVSAFVGNRRLALAAAFLINDLLTYIDISELNPASLRLNPWLAGKVGGGFPLAFFYVAGLAVLCILVLFLGMQRIYQRSG